MTHSNATYTKTIKPVRKEAPQAFEATQRARKDARQQARKDKQVWRDLEPGHVKETVRELTKPDAVTLRRLRGIRLTREWVEHKEEHNG